MSENSKQQISLQQWLILITICAMYFFSPTFSAVSSTLSLMPEHYGVSASAVSWISAMANPTCCISGLLIGTIVGRKVSYRLASIFSMLFFTVFGGLPFIWQSIPFGGLLACRLLFGLGVGCINPLVQSIITRMFSDETVRSVWIGAINVIFSIGASLGSMITGALSSSGVWQNAYAFYLFAAIPLVMAIIFVKDREILADESTSTSEKESETGTEKRHIPGVAWAFIIMFAISTIITQTFFNYVGIAMGESGANTLLIGTVFTVFTVIGIVVAAGNAAFWRFLRLWNFPLAFAFLTLSYVFCIMGTTMGSTALFFAGSVSCGIGCALVGMVMPMVMSITCTAASLTLAIGFQEVARNLGSFLSAPWLNAIGSLFGDTSITQFTAVMILGLVCTVVACLLVAKNNRRFKNTELNK